MSAAWIRPAPPDDETGAAVLGVELVAVAEQPPALTEGGDTTAAPTRATMATANWKKLSYREHPHERIQSAQNIEPWPN